MSAFRGMQGLGDNVYQRAFIKSAVKSSPVVLETPWPEIYEGIPNLRLVKPSTQLRTQAKNISRADASLWSNTIVNRMFRISYGNEGILRGMRRGFGVDCSTFDLPDFESPIDGDYVVIRPVTVRKEWQAESRAPLPEYVAQCADVLIKRGIRVISVADLKEGEEWALDPLPKATERYHKGEFDVKQLLGLVRKSKMVIGGVGWIVPVAIAYQTPAWIIFGGQGGYNAPEALWDESRMNVRNLGYALPDSFCRCTSNLHTCNKRIRNHEQLFTRWLARFAALEPRVEDGLAPAQAHGLRLGLLC